MNKHILTFESPKGQENFEYIAVDEANIPQTLKDISQWVLWFAAIKLDMTKETKPDKIPLTPNLYAAKTNNKKSWATFQQVINAYNQHKGKKTTLSIYGEQRTGIIAGIGFVLTKEIGITGIDVDKCINDNKINLFATDIIENLNSYTEISPSGTGIRSFVFAKKPDGGCKHTATGFEIYNFGRFLTVTGQKIVGDEVAECQKAVDDIHKSIFAPVKKYNKRHSIPEKQHKTILEKAFSSNKDIKILFDGNFEADQSAADLALCNHLAFWFGKNYSVMDDVFRSSGLMRPKWDTIHVRGETYGAVTLQKAIDNCKECYGRREFNNELGIYESIAKEVDLSTPAPPISFKDTLSPFDFPNVTDKFKPQSTKENLAFLLYRYGISCKYNEIKKNIEIVIPCSKYGDDNKTNCAIAEIISLCAKNSVPQHNIQDYITLIASENSYNPVIDWINSKPWDGVNRMQDICNTVHSPVQENFKTCLILRWMLSCVACLFEKNFTSHGVLVFVGEQGTGKTSWLKRLAPESMNVILEGASIDTMNKDTIINATSHWLVELGELDATFRKSDISRLKAFVTQTTDKIRQPYARSVSEYPRRTVFFGSVNDTRYLVDDTGNRRWWTIPVEKIDYSHNIDMQQLWAEVYSFYKDGQKWWLNDEETKMLNAHNEEYQQLDPIEEKILSSYNSDDKYNLRQITATDVLIELGFERPTKSQATLAGKILTKNFGEPKKNKKGRFYTLGSKA